MNLTITLGDEQHLSSDSISFQSGILNKFCKYCSLGYIIVQ